MVLFKTETTTTYKNGKKTTITRKIPIKEEKTKIISIGGKAPTVTSRGAGKNPVYTKKGTTPVINSSGKVTALEPTKAHVNYSEEEMTGESLSPELQAELKEQKPTTILRDTLIKSTPEQKTSEKEYQIKTMEVYQRSVRNAPTYRTITTDYDTAGEPIKQTEEIRAKKGFFTYGLTEEQERAKKLYPSYKLYIEGKTKEPAQVPQGTILKQTVKLNKGLSTPYTKVEKNVLNYLKFESKIKEYKTKLGYDPNYYKTWNLLTSKVKINNKEYDTGQTFLSKEGAAYIKNFSLDLIEFVVTALPKATVMLQLGREAYKGNKLYQQEFKETLYKTPKAIVSTYDLRYPRGWINLGLTFLAVKNVAKSPSNLGKKGYTKYHVLKSSRLFKPKTTGKPFVLKEYKVVKGNIITGKKPTIKIYKGDKLNTQATLKGYRITPKQASKLLYSDKPKTLYTLKSNPLKPSYKGVTPTGQTKLITNKVIAADLSKGGVYYPVKRVGGNVYISKNNLWFEYKPKSYAFKTTSFKQIKTTPQVVFQRPTTQYTLYGSKVPIIKLTTTFKPIKPPTSIKTQTVGTISFKTKQKATVGYETTNYAPTIKATKFYKETPASQLTSKLVIPKQKVYIPVLTNMKTRQNFISSFKRENKIEQSYKTSQDTKLIQINKAEITEITIPKPIVIFRPITKQGSTIKQKQKQEVSLMPVIKSKYIQKTIPKQKVIPFIPSWEKYTPTNPPPTFLFPNLKIPKNKRSIIKDTKITEQPKRKKKYRPQFAAIGFSKMVFGKPSKFGLKSGLGFRGIV